MITAVNDVQRARAEILRRDATCAAWVMRVVNLAGRITAPQLVAVARGRWSESAVRSALVRLRLAGFVRKTSIRRGRARRWEPC
jgi:hypothetical protein